MKRITRHFNPATVMALVAMIFAMGGGAFAATGGGAHTASHKGHKGHNASAKHKKGKGKAKAKRGPRGPEGKEGPAGPTGPAGPAGPAGTKGDTGAAGAPGAAGAAGAAGESVKITAEGECTKFSNASGEGKACAGKAGEAGKSVEVIPGEPASCKGNGGVTYEVEESGSPTAVCDGAPGVIHPGETLPVGASETGTWAFNASVQTITTEVEGVKQEIKVGDTGAVYAPISFTVPLSANLSSTKVEYVPLGTKGTACTGTLLKPTAPEGELCVYGPGSVGGVTSGSIRVPASGGVGAGMQGALVKFEGLTGTVTEGHGVWVVTAG